MAPSATLVRDSPTSRWLRRSAPFWILLGIALLMTMPGVLNGPHDHDSTAKDVQPHPLSHFALPEQPDARAQRMTERRDGS